MSALAAFGVLFASPAASAATFVGQDHTVTPACVAGAFTLTVGIPATDTHNGIVVVTEFPSGKVTTTPLMAPGTSTSFVLQSSTVRITSTDPGLAVLTTDVSPFACPPPAPTTTTTVAPTTTAAPTPALTIATVIPDDGSSTQVLPAPVATPTTSATVIPQPSLAPLASTSIPNAGSSTTVNRLPETGSDKTLLLIVAALITSVGVFMVNYDKKRKTA
jgi:LPXTG-motif cell wall-anchored protein